MAVAVDFQSMTSSLADIDVESTSYAELSEVVLAAEMLLNAARALSAVALEAFERRRIWADDGALSGAAWTASRTGTPRRTLRARVRAGAGLRLLPSAAPAARAGRLSPGQVGAPGRLRQAASRARRP